MSGKSTGSVRPARADDKAGAALRAPPRQATIGTPIRTQGPTMKRLAAAFLLLAGAAHGDGPAEGSAWRWTGLS
jgi:hypothetical protein